MWQYRARIIDVIDSRTIDVQVDLGFHIQTRTRVTLAGGHLPIGLDATEQADAWVRAHDDGSSWPFILTTGRIAWDGLDEDHERYLGRITTPYGVSLNRHLLRWADGMPF